jgi:hypothetical protein
MAAYQKNCYYRNYYRLRYQPPPKVLYKALYADNRR